MAICNPIIDPNCSQNIVDSSIDKTSSIISIAITILLIVGAIFFVFNIILAGFAFMNSHGDEKQLSTARSKIIGAFTGLIVIFSIYAILALFKTIFQIDLVEFNIPTLQ